MKNWENAILFPLGLVAAGLTYKFLKTRIHGSTSNNDLLNHSVDTGNSSSVVPTTWANVLPMQPRIAIVEIFGPIRGGPKVGQYVNLIESLRADKRVRSVVLEIDSPGGSAPASEYFYNAVERLAHQKPVIAFIRGIGASGAYMVACGASKIIALPSSIIGSIGVISISPIAKGMLSKLGVEVAVSKSGPYKDMGAFYREASDDELKKQQGLVDQFFDNFVNLVAESRDIPEQKVRSYATGEVFTGRKAAEYGLVDEIGDMDRAIGLAAELGKVPRRIMYARPKYPLFQRIFSRMSSSFVEELVETVESRLESKIQYRSFAK